MSNVKSNPAKLSINILLRDEKGKPKIDEDKLGTFWDVLSEEDKAYLRDQYPNTTIGME